MLVWYDLHLPERCFNYHCSFQLIAHVDRIGEWWDCDLEEIVNRFDADKLHTCMHTLRFSFHRHASLLRLLKPFSDDETERPYRLIDMNTGRTPATRMEWGSLEISESVKTGSERGYYYVGQHNLVLYTPGNFECSQSFRAYCILFWCSESLPWNGVIKRQNKRSTFKFFEVPLYLKFSN